MLKMKSMFERKKILPLVLALAHSILKEMGMVSLINRMVQWNPDHWEMTPGDLATLMILSTFTDIRTPLTHLADRFEGIDVGFFLSASSKSGSVNSFNAGRALERIGQADSDQIYEILALSAIRQAGIPTQRLHADTTTVSFYGEYDIDTSGLSQQERAEWLEIERGYNKDGRPQCKQVVVGHIVNEEGIPVASRTMDGTTADTEWNAVAIQYLQQLQGRGFQYGIFVADSKLMTHDLVTSMNEPEHRVDFVSRCPANFEGKLESRMIRKAYEEGNWETIGALSGGKNASEYCLSSYEEEVCGAPVRLLVLESSSLKEKAKVSLGKERELLEERVKGLEKKVFRCEADVQEELERFSHEKGLKLYECIYEIEKETQEKWPRGRRGKETKPRLETGYHIRVREIREKAEECEEYRRKESCIVLMSNAGDNYTDLELIKTYKGQQVVENSFRELKSPSMASVIYLKNPDRIKGLTMLLTLSLLVRAIIQYRLREGLKRYEEKAPGEKLYVGWGNRPLKNPTYRLFYEHSVNCYYEKEEIGNYSYAWPTMETKQRVETLLMLMGVSLESLLN